MQLYTKNCLQLPINVLIKIFIWNCLKRRKKPSYNLSSRKAAFAKAKKQGIEFNAEFNAAFTIPSDHILNCSHTGHGLDWIGEPSRSNQSANFAMKCRTLYLLGQVNLEFYCFGDQIS